MFKEFGVITFQAEDEIAAVTSSIGAAYGGRLALTTTSGPGMALKMEAIGLAIATGAAARDLRHPARRSLHGLPTKTEQADLLQALYGRNSEGAGAGAGRVHARRLLLGGHGSEPHRDQIHGPRHHPVRRLPRERRGAVEDPDRGRAAGDPGALPDGARRASSPTSAIRRRCRAPGPSPERPGLEHRIGGLEKQDVTGNVNYEPLNHERMVRLRAAKVAGIVQDVPDVVPAGDAEGDLLLVAWGSTYGAITAALGPARAKGHRRRPRAPAPPQPAAEQPGRGHEALQEGGRCRR
jgi:2-oxoglutarate ferredoxin oxidoreductase subunit alpha